MSAEPNATSREEEPLPLGRVARQFGVSRSTVYRWIVEGRLKAHSLPSGHFRVRPRDIIEFRSSYGIPESAEFEAVTPTPAGAPPARVAVAAEPEDDGPANLRLLIAEDHPETSLVLRRLAGHFLPQADLHTAANGIDAVLAAATVMPHLLILDIMMPGMDGFQVLSALVRRSTLAQMRIVVVTAYEPFSRVEALRGRHPQVAACFRKPIPDLQEVGWTLQRLARETVGPA